LKKPLNRSYGIYFKITKYQVIPGFMKGFNNFTSQEGKPYFTMIVSTLLMQKKLLIIILISWDKQLT